MMKKFLGHKKAKGIGLRDLFPQEKMAEVNQLNKIGNFLRMEKVITKYRVINIGNAPVIQVIYEDGKFYTTMDQEKIDEILKIMPEDDEMEQDSQQQGSQQDSQQQGSQQDSQQNDTEQQQQAPLVLYSGGGAKPKKPTSNNETGDIRGEETGGRGGSSRSGSGQQEGAVGGAVGGASGGGRGGRTSGKSSRNASSSRGRSGSGASSGKKPDNSDSDKASYAQKAATRGGLANRTKKPEESRIMKMFLARKLGASGKD